jgi:hypothetical protein
VTWTGGAAKANVDIQVSSATDVSLFNAVTVDCKAPASAGSLTIPAYVLNQLPPGSFTSFNFQQYLTAPFIAPSLNFGAFNLKAAPLGFNGVQLK